MNGAIAVKFQFWWGEGAKISHDGRLAMGEDSRIVSFGQTKPDWGRKFRVRCGVGWLAPFGCFLKAADVLIWGKGGSNIKDHRANGHQCGA